MRARYPPQVAARAEIVRELNELIKAIDLRVPRVQRSGEAAIANAAARLKADALTRIREIELEMSGWESLDSQPS